MKTKRILGWLGMAVVASGLQMACGVGVQEGEKEGLSSLEKPASAAIPAPSVKGLGLRQKPQPLGLAKLSKAQLPGVLQPVGVWKGVLTWKDKSQEDVVLRLEWKQTAFKMPDLRKKRVAPKASWWDKLFLGVAHACGPYAPAVSLPLSGAWKASRAETSPISGIAETHDNFAFSSSVAITLAGGRTLHGWLFQDAKSGSFRMEGSLFEATGKAEEPYLLLGSFALSRTTF